MGLASVLLLVALGLGSGGPGQLPPGYKPPPPMLTESKKAKELGEKLLEAQLESRLLDALKLAKRRLKLMERAAKSRKDPSLQRYVDDVARMMMSTGSYADALPLFERSVAMAKSWYGEDSELTAIAIDSLATQHWIRGDYEKAEPLMDRSTEIRVRLYGPDSFQVAVRSLTRAGFAMARYDYVEAERLYRETLEIYERIGQEDAQIASVEVSMGFMYKMRGDLKRAERIFRDAVERYASAGEVWESSVATYQAILADVLAEAGKDDEARAWDDKALAIHDRAIARAKSEHGEGSSMHTSALRMKASLLQQRKRFEEARQIQESVLAFDDKEHGKDSAATLGTKIVLARLYDQMGELDASRKLYEAVLKVQKRSWGKTQTMSTELMLSMLDEKQGRWKDADKRMKRVRSAYEKTWGKSHSYLSPIVLRQGLVRWAQGKTKDAIAYLEESQDIIEPHLRVLLQTGTEQDRRKQLTDNAYHLDVALSLNAEFPDNARATELGLLVALRRKGRLLDAMADTMGSLRRRLGPKERKILDGVTARRAELAQLVTKGPDPGKEADYQRRLASLEERIRTLEVEIARRSKEFAVHNAPVTVEAIRRRIPDGAALVELVVFKSHDPKKPVEMAGQGTPHVMAYVVRAKGPLEAVDLGPATRIESAATPFREALADPDADDVKALGRSLDRLTFAKIRPLLGTTRRVLLAPDGALNLVPVAALVDDNGRFLVERYHFTYLTSGRDLLRLDAELAPRGGPVIFAAPDFDGTGVKPAPAPEPDQPKGSGDRPKTRGRRAFDLTSLKWEPLPGTAQEAAALTEVLAADMVRIGPEATEEALKSIAAPDVLHVATHGFFLPDDAGAQTNPLLRSGLALSGANRLESQTEDGVLTALEATGLDLWGTELVVLSACETGVGQVQVGEGVYGLRRALVLAGSESQLLSLWQVDDEATQELMVGVYKGLRAGRGRGESLRSMQLEMLRDPEREHPFFWASFVPAGDWRPLTAPAP